MNARIPAAFAAALAVALPCLANGLPAAESSFDGARLKDDLTGALADPAKVVEVRFYASAGSKFSLTVSTPSGGTPIAGLAAELYDDAHVDLGVAGGPHDKTVAGSGEIKWSGVPLAATGGYVVVLTGTAAGDWRMQFSGTVAALKTSESSAADLPVGGEAAVDFDGLARGTLSYKLASTGSSKFAGELVRIERPDGSTLLAGPAEAKGKVVLDADGPHRLVFTNAGKGIGPWKASASVTPASPKKRTGHVSPAGTALVPVVTSVSPSSGYQKDRELAFTVTGRDFQPGADVRLLRDGRADVLGQGTVVVSETSITCTLDLDTALVDGQDSKGTWKVGVWNAPVYSDPLDRRTLVKESATRDTRKTFECVTSSSITLPPGVVKDTEVWQLVFNDDFTGDLRRMGLGSVDLELEFVVRVTVEYYTVAYLRDLFACNETTGKLAKTGSVPVCFVTGKVPAVAGLPGRDFNRIEIGGAYEVGDERDPAEPLFWGHSPVDAGNAHREDLSVSVDDGAGSTVRVGRGARTRVLDPLDASAATNWAVATSALRQTPLVPFDRRYFTVGFYPADNADASRYREIVQQVERVSREVAAIVAHHVGRAMGLPTGGAGPMASPDKAGAMWLERSTLDFSQADATTLRAAAVPAALPGKSAKLFVPYLPLVPALDGGTRFAKRPPWLPDATTDEDYSTEWNWVGGRCNALPQDLSVEVTRGTLPPGIEVGRLRISGKAPLRTDAGQVNGGIAYFRVTATDLLRGGGRSFAFRLNVLPNLPRFQQGTNDYLTAQNLYNAILATP